MIPPLKLSVPRRARKMTEYMTALRIDARKIWQSKSEMASSIIGSIRTGSRWKKNCNFG